MGAHRYTLLDVFTATPLAGNGLAVVHGADDVHEATMLAFARETRLSETTDVRLDGEHATASMLQEPAVHGPELERPRVLAAIGLTPEHADRRLPPQVVAAGLGTLVVPLRDRDALAQAAPDYAAIAELLRPTGALTLYAVVCDPEQGRACARSFVSAAVGEDPATGSAAGPLCAYLAARTGCARVAIEQGVEMGRPSRIDAAMEGSSPRVGGDVVVIVDGIAHL